jgi:transposase
MSTSLLYHGFGIRGYEHVRIDFFEGEVIFTIRQKPDSLRCPVCGGGNVVGKGRRWRVFKSVPIGCKPVKIVWGVPRVRCHDCGVVRQVKIGFADERRSYTRAFERYALELLHSMTIRDVAAHLRVGWDLIKDIQKRYLDKHFAKPPLKHVRQIAIDEISIGHGHRYLTVVLDLESGAVVHVGDGKGAEALHGFWKRLRSSGARVQAVAMDMSAAYIQAVRRNLPGAVTVFDHFHIVKLLNEKLSELRRQLYREATDQLQKQVLKGTRWLLLKRPERLDEERREHARLLEALKLNESLAIAYYLKEDLRQLWEQPDQQSAAAVMDDWIAAADCSGIRVLRNFARTLAIHRRGILAWYDYPISTGPLEGTNNKIRTMQRQAYGFRDQHFLKLKILALHMTRYALVG